LLSRSGRAELERIIIDDEENLHEALESGVELLSLFHAGDESISAELRARLPQSVTIHEVALRTCKKLFGNEKISRVFAIAQAPKRRAVTTLAELSQDIVVLEDVGIAGNVGAIIRTALALGASGLVLIDYDPVDIYDRRLIRASRGHVFSLPVVTASIDELLEFCDTQGVKLTVTTLQATVSVSEISTLADRLAIVFGSEKRGCSDAVMKAATLRVKIPMSLRVESLNVSAAAGIVLQNRSRFNRVPGG